MRKSIKCLCCFLMLISLAGSATVYGDDSQPPAAANTPPSSAGTATDNSLPPGEINVIFNIAPRQDNGKLYFDVETNLPDGMIFMGAIRDEMGFVCKIDSTMERVQTEITDGKLTLGPFPFEDKSFPPGEYTLYVNSYPGEDQPENVIDVIGQNGANLTGQDVIGGMVLFGKMFMITGEH